MSLSSTLVSFHQAEMAAPDAAGECDCTTLHAFVPDAAVDWPVALRHLNDDDDIGGTTPADAPTSVDINNAEQQQQPNPCVSLLHTWKRALFFTPHPDDSVGAAFLRYQFRGVIGINSLLLVFTGCWTFVLSGLAGADTGSNEQVGWTAIVVAGALSIPLLIVYGIAFFSPVYVRSWAPTVLNALHTTAFCLVMVLAGISAAVNYAELAPGGGTPPSCIPPADRPRATALLQPGANTTAGR